jgi:hypothetical protein
MEILSLVETASRTLATNKSEMRSLLRTWLRLSQQEGNPEGEYPKGLQRALKVLDKSASLPEMLAKLRRQESQESPEPHLQSK